MHGPDDCEDCGVYHLPASAHRRAAEKPLRARERYVELYGMAPDGRPLYVEVEEPDELE